MESSFLYLELSKRRFDGDTGGIWGVRVGVGSGYYRQ